MKTTHSFRCYPSATSDNRIGSIILEIGERQELPEVPGNEHLRIDTIRRCKGSSRIESRSARQTLLSGAPGSVGG